MNIVNNEKLALTVEEAAKALGIGRNLAYESIQSGDLPSVKIGKRLIVPKAALEKLLAGAGQSNLGG